MDMDSDEIYIFDIFFAFFATKCGRNGHLKSNELNQTESYILI